MKHSDFMDIIMGDISVNVSQESLNGTLSCVYFMDVIMEIYPVMCLRKL